jgi:hypothetical protein
MEPKAYRPLYNQYRTIGTIIEQNDIYKMTEQEWQTQCMIHSNGNMHPIQALDIFRQLKREAGL